MSISTATIFLSGWNSTGITVAGIIGSAGTNTDRLTNPFGVKLDTANTIYIADRDKNRIQRWHTGATSGTTVSGQASGTSGVALNCLNNPGNVEIDSNGNLYVTEIFNYKVLFWSNSTSTDTIVAGIGT
ncbi:unnamed protein product [Rotaria magnacalcarata]|uniref:Uncharacterized protein n=2 Tax=Rotaria magnacalcarata TaxID=392030 RepID=A0A819QN62_9BILA|nr:unnamed protein product [Rotaria magnacalcarata]CAF2086017.1 unnamed protein product [Rotaria magnacalcarata]CAF4026801.1 unnamed protein product [Rotaria magnacalcarata]CAF4141215.1 unnamed protein product [Rotaria magnacalcarata]